MIILEGKKIIKKYSVDDNTTVVLNDINFKINDGDFISIMGKSGSGKSTLLYVLSGLEKPSSGEVLFQGKSIINVSDKEMSNIRRRDIGFIFQFYNLVPTLNVFENIALPLELTNLKMKNYKNKINDMIERLGLADKSKNFPYQLSGGQQQKVSIARAVITNPKILFADEPTGNLDSASSNEIIEIFKSLNEEDKKTILMVTHDIGVSQIAKETINISDGKVISCSKNN